MRKVLDRRILLFISFLAWFLHPAAKTLCSDNLLFTQHLATRVSELHLAIKTLCSDSWKLTMKEGGKQKDLCRQNLVLLLCTCSVAFPGFSVHQATLSRVIGS